jgi:membrane protein
MLSARVREKLALLITYLIGAQYRQGQPAIGVEQLSARLDVPRESVADVVSALQRHRILLSTRDDPPRFVPGRALEAIAVKDVLDAAREAGEPEGILMAHLPSAAEVDDTIGHAERAVARSLEQVTFQDLCREEERRAEASGKPP